MSEFRLEDVIHPVVGWSLDDVASAIKAGDVSIATVDFAFIDAGYSDSAAIDNVPPIRPFVNVSKPYATFSTTSDRFRRRWGMSFSRSMAHRCGRSAT